MPLSLSACRSELGKAFDKNDAAYLGPISSNQDAKDRTVQGWANALEKCAQGITPPSTSLAAAKAAMISAMTGSFADLTGATWLASFQAFTAALATGMSPLYTATPPAQPPILNAPMPSMASALDAHAAAIVAWLKTGSATPSAGGSPIAWA